MDYGLAIIHVNNYKDIGKVAQFVVELDKLYSFNEKKPKSIKHIEAGAISFSYTDSSIGDTSFSFNKRNRLKYNNIYNKLVDSYIKQLKKFGLSDNTIPEDVWGKYH